MTASRDALVVRVAALIRGRTGPWEADAAAILGMPEAEGWGPCVSRCRHHDGTCSAIVDANEAMGEALTAARAEVERLRGLLSQACDEIDDQHATQSLFAVTLRRQGGITPTEETSRG